MISFAIPSDAARHSELMHRLWDVEMRLRWLADYPEEVRATPEVAERLRKCREALAKLEPQQPNQGEGQ